MGKSFLKGAPEQKGVVPACTGALLKIKEFERLKTKPKEGKKQKRMYHATFEIKQPKSVKGMNMHEYFVIGTEEDPLAKLQETWERSEGGPGRLSRLMSKANIEVDDDDDQIWMDAAVEHGDEIVAPIVVRPDRETGEPRANLGLFFAPDDDDCPEIGLADELDGKGKRSAKKRSVEDEDEEEVAPKKKGAKAAADDDEEEQPKKKGKAAADDDDEEVSPKRKKSKTRKADDDE